MRSIEELRGLVTAVTRVDVQERHHLRHLLLLQLAGPAPRAEARPPLVHGAGRRLLRVPGVPVPPPQHRVLYCTVLYCTVLHCTVQVSQYLYLNTVTVYLAAVLLGFGGPIIWTAQVSYNSHFCCHNHSPLCCVQGTFLTRNSDSATITRNSGIFWAILKTSGLIGNMAAFFLFRDQEILQRRTWVLLGAVLTAVSGLGTVLLLLLRKCSPEF